MEIDSLGIFAVFVVALWGMGMRLIAQRIDYAIDNLDRKSHTFELSEDLKQQLYDILGLAIEDSIGNIQPPSALDHAIGAFSTFMQHRMMRSMPPNIIEGAAELMSDYGEAQVEENH